MRYLLILLVLLLGCNPEPEYIETAIDPACGLPASIEGKIWDSDYISRATLSSVSTATQRAEGPQWLPGLQDIEVQRP